MGEEERRRCCMLGGCGCGPGSLAQREAWASWLKEKLQSGEYEDQGESVVQKWLDELPWVKD